MEGRKRIKTIVEERECEEKKEATTTKGGKEARGLVA
jgi:hypothetical protein